VCEFVERKVTRWEEMESGNWQVTQRPDSVDLLNVGSGRTVTFAFTQPPSPARGGQEVPFEIRCTAPPGFEEQGAIGKHWRTTQAQAEMHLEALGGASLSCQADNSHPNGHNDALVRLSLPRAGEAPGRRELVKLQVKAVVGNDYYYLFFGWWYDCR
jgi:hypothetical protein